MLLIIGCQGWLTFAPKPKSQFESIGSPQGILATASRSGTVYMNCVSSGDPVTASITR